MPAPPQEAARADFADPIERGGPIPAFPTDHAERGIEMLSRLAGPLVFILALGGIAWMLLK